MIATPPPFLTFLFLGIHLYSSIFGGSDSSLVSAIKAIDVSCSFIADVRLVIFPVIPFAFEYRILSCLALGCFLLFRLLAFLFTFLNVTFLGFLVWLVFALSCFSMLLSGLFGSVFELLGVNRGRAWPRLQ